MHIEIFNKKKYINTWFNNKTIELFKDFKKTTDLSDVLINIPEYYTFIPHYNGNSKMIDIMKKELISNNTNFVVAEIKNDTKLTHDNQHFEFDIPPLTDLLYGYKFNTKIKSFELLYNNNSIWEPILKINNYNHDIIPILPTLEPLNLLAITKTKFKIKFIPESTKSISIFGLWAMTDNNLSEKLKIFTGNIGSNMIINNNQFNIY